MSRRIHSMTLSEASERHQRESGNAKRCGECPYFRPSWCTVLARTTQAWMLACKYGSVKIKAIRQAGK